MTDPIYILIRTSNRPKFFCNMMKSIKMQTYKNIKTIVHSDNSFDSYYTGDIVIHSKREYQGTAPYNIYCNLLLENIPDTSGWFYFLDDDDELINENVISEFIKNSKIDSLNVCKVIRGNGIVFPLFWGKDKSFQTESFLLHTNHKNIARWGKDINGDRKYTKEIAKILPINWIENLIVCKAQDGKGYGNRLDKN